MRLGSQIDKIAVVGTFGCGKTTVLDAIKRKLEHTKASVQIIEEYPKKLFLTEPYSTKPTHEWPLAWFREVQEKTIHGVREEEELIFPQKKLTIVESYWANILPYTILNFGEGHELTTLVRERIHATLENTMYVYLEHKGIPLDATNRHADEVLRDQVAEDIQKILWESHAHIVQLTISEEERARFVEELCKDI